MKIAIPLTATDEFSAHYGGSSKLAVFEVDPEQRVVRRRTILAPSGSEPCNWSPLLRAAGVTLLLAGGIGTGARHRMAEHGVDVIAGAASGTPDEVVAAWLSGGLVRGENACDGSGQGGHHHDGSCHCAH
ncbi:MAG: NifB/NifX family molybdenum-iron cluster-binding protein [Opitutaceae bacterium]|nr:NifB/NifX family molybdenum-iron cluster-binding protein [Opitutaceae bacterium]